MNVSSRSTASQLCDFNPAGCGDPPFSVSSEEAPGGMSAVFLTSQSCLSTCRAEIGFERGD